MKKLLVFQEDHFSLRPAQLQRLARIVPELDLYYGPPGAVTASMAQEAQVAVGCPAPDLLAGMPQLMWLHLTKPIYTPYNQLSLYANPHITVTKPTGVYAPSMADYALHTFGEGVARNRDDLSLWGACVTVVGAGAYAWPLMEVLAAMGCHIRLVRRNLMEKPRQAASVAALADLPALLHTSDFTVICLPVTQETRGLLSESFFAQARADSVVCVMGESGLWTPMAEPVPVAFCQADLWAGMSPMPGVFVTEGQSLCFPGVMDAQCALLEKRLIRYAAGRRQLDALQFFRGY